MANQINYAGASQEFSCIRVSSGAKEAIRRAGGEVVDGHGIQTGWGVHFPSTTVLLEDSERVKIFRIPNEQKPDGYDFLIWTYLGDSLSLQS